MHRTADELRNSQMNYYIIFRLDPALTDVEAIRKTMLSVKNRWTQGGAQNQRFIELYSDMESVMLQDLAFDESRGTYSVTGARKKEAAAAKKFKLREAVDCVVAIGRGRGRVLKSDVEKIANADEIRWFTLEELEKGVAHLFSQGVKYIDDSQKLIDFSTYKGMEKNLAPAKVVSLYDLLGKKPTDPLPELNAAITAIYSKLRRETTEGTAKDKLLGKARMIFKTPESKKAYDDYLAIKPTVWDELESRKNFGIQEISLEDFLRYAEIIRSTLHFSIDQTEEYLVAGLKEFRLRLAGAETGAAIDLEVCPYPDCRKAYRVEKGRDVKVCPHCGKALEIPCWNCASKMPFTEKSKTCPKCAASEQMHALFNKSCAAADAAFRRPDATIPSMQAAIAALSNIVPGYRKAPGCLVARKVEEYEKIVSQKKTEEETVGKKYKADLETIRKLRSQKKLLQALSAARNLSGNYPGYNAEISQKTVAELENELAPARRLVEQARRSLHTGGSAQAVGFAAQALTICEDEQEARQILERFPPDAPRNLRLRVAEDSVQIQWETAGEQSGVRYTVLKKIGSAPGSRTDGVKVAEGLTIHFVEDDAITPATPCYYGVYAERYGVCSALATSSAPVQIFPDVTGLRQGDDPGAVVLRWSLPQGVHHVEVFKKEGMTPPTGPENGTPVVLQRNDSLTDTDKGTHSYLIRCVYLSGGKTCKSKGVAGTFRRFEPLQTPGTVTITPVSAGGFLLKGLRPNAGERVEVRYAKNALPCEVGKPFRITEQKRVLGSAMIASCRSNGEGEYRFDLPVGQICWAYPVLMNDQLMMLLPPSFLNTLPGVEQLTYTVSEGKVTVKGTISPNVSRVLLKYDPDAFPETPEDTGFTVRADAAQFTSGGISVKLPVDRTYYLSIFAAVEKDGQISYTSAAKIGSGPFGTPRRVVVDYKLDLHRGRSETTVKVSLFCSEEITAPELVLVRGRPVLREDGVAVGTIAATPLQKGLFSKVYKGCATLKVPGGFDKCKLFVADPANSGVTLRELNS